MFSLGKIHWNVLPLMYTHLLVTHSLLILMLMKVQITAVSNLASNPKPITYIHIINSNCIYTIITATIYYPSHHCSNHLIHFPI